MTDARYPERWLHDRRVTRLSDRAHRAYVVTLAYAVANRTDGMFTVEDLADLPRYVEQEVPALIEAGLWLPIEDGTGFRAVDYFDTQTSRAELEALDRGRLAAREKKARQRATAKVAPTDPEPASAAVPGDVPGDQTGQARTGQARTGSTTGPATEQEQTTWPDVAVPGSGGRSARAVPASDCHGCGWAESHGAGCRFAA